MEHYSPRDSLRSGTTSGCGKAFNVSSKAPGPTSLHLPKRRVKECPCQRWRPGSSRSMDIDGLELGSDLHLNLNDEATNGRSRKRVSRACDRCRVKKDKCDAGKPSCSACIASNLVCTYDPSSKKRGLPEGYVRGMEKLWALAVIKINGLEHAIRHIAADDQTFNLWNQDVSGEILHTRWKGSGVLHELESMLSRSEQESGTNRKRKRGGDDDTSATPEDLVAATHGLGADFRLVAAREERFLSEERPAATPALIPIRFPTTATSILEHYFAYTHSWLPMVEKHQVMRTFHEYSRGQRHASQAELAVLCAIMAYTTAQTEHESLDIAPSTMLAMTRGLIPDEAGPFEPPHVQALLLITLLKIGQSHWDEASVIIGKAIRVGLGIRPSGRHAFLSAGHSDAAPSNDTPSTKRFGPTMRAAFMLDTLVSAHLTLPPHLRRFDVLEFGYLEEDGSEDWEPWRAPETFSGSLEPCFMNRSFNRFSDLLLIMNDIMNYNAELQIDRRLFFENRRTALAGLKGEYPESTERALAPHDMLLRLFHCGVDILISKGLFEADGPAEPCARSACEMLAVLNQQQQKPALAFRNISPIIEIPLRIASIAAIASKPALETIPDLPSYARFASSITTSVVQFSSTWPVFSPLASLLRTDTLQNGTSLHASHINGETHEWSNETKRTTVDQSQTHVPEAWASIRNASMSSAIDPELNREHDFGSIATNLQIKMADRLETNLQTTGTSTFTPAGFAMPAGTDASPSLSGDDVDAIFHNLIHLDTTDWTDNRQKGLADFGFADDAAFQAFCNDPDRLLATNDSTGQAVFNPSAEPWPPPGLFPGHFSNQQDAQMEVSQILQSLAGQSQSSEQTSTRGAWWG